MFERTQEFDAQGFPVPGGFNEFPRRNEMPEPADAAEKRPPASSRRGVRVMRLFLVLLFLGMGAVALYHSEARDYVREALAQWQARQAMRSVHEGDLQGALSHMDYAVALAPENSDFLQARAWLRLRNNNLQGSLDDLNQLIERNPRNGSFFSSRSDILQRLERHEEAIADANRVVELNGGRDAQALNNRAYTRARANLEITEGLEDIKLALEIIGEDDWNVDRETLAAYLDTRGFLRYRNKDYADALTDLNRAISLTEEQRDRRALRGDAQFGRRRRRSNVSQFAESLAVMYYHRSLVWESLGNREEAANDARVAQGYGYNPLAGVF